MKNGARTEEKANAAPAARWWGTRAVSLPNAKPAPRATIPATAIPSWSASAVTTGANGDFSFSYQAPTAVGSGQVTITGTATYLSEAPQSGSATLTGSAGAPEAIAWNPVTTTVRAATPVTVSGVVPDANGNPVPSATVNLTATYQALSAGSFDNSSPQTDANGAFLLTDVPAGRYTIVARRVGYVATSRTIPLSAGDRAAVDLRLPSIIGNLEPVVVTATRQAIDVKQSPLPVSELAGDRLHRDPMGVHVVRMAVEPVGVVGDDDVHQLTSV